MSAGLPVEQAYDLLRILGPQTADEWLRRGVRLEWLAELVNQRRAIEVRVGNESRYAAIEDAGRLRATHSALRSRQGFLMHF